MIDYPIIWIGPIDAGGLGRGGGGGGGEQQFVFVTTCNKDHPLCWSGLISQVVSHSGDLVMQEPLYMLYMEEIQQNKFELQTSKI